MGKPPYVLIKSMNCERQGAGQVLEAAFLGNIYSCLTAAALVAPFCQEHTESKPRSDSVTANIPRTLKKEKGNIHQWVQKQTIPDIAQVPTRIAWYGVVFYHDWTLPIYSAIKTPLIPPKLAVKNLGITFYFTAFGWWRIKREDL